MRIHRCEVECKKFITSLVVTSGVAGIALNKFLQWNRSKSIAYGLTSGMIAACVLGIRSISRVGDDGVDSARLAALDQAELRADAQSQQERARSVKALRVRIAQLKSNDLSTILATATDQDQPSTLSLDTAVKALEKAVELPDKSGVFLPRVGAFAQITTAASLDWILYCAQVCQMVERTTGQPGVVPSERELLLHLTIMSIRPHQHIGSQCADQIQAAARVGMKWREPLLSYRPFRNCPEGGFILNVAESMYEIDRFASS